MNCRDYRTWLQKRLDEATVAEVPALADHLASCPSCKSWQAAARRLQQCLANLDRPRPPEGLSLRITSRVLQAQRQHRRRRWLVTAALAASLLLMLFAGFAASLSARLGIGRHLEGQTVTVQVRASNSDDRIKSGVQPLAFLDIPLPRKLARSFFQALETLMALGATSEKPVQRVQGPSVREGVVEVSSVVASWTKRAADQTVEQNGPLLREVVRASLPDLELGPVLDPSTRPLLEAGQGVPMGLEPVTNSARRAVDLILREVPSMTPQDM